MKVTGLKTMVVEAEKPYIGGKYFLLLELETDQGITGIGERIAGSSYYDHHKDNHAWLMKHRTLNHYLVPCHLRPSH